VTTQLQLINIIIIIIIIIIIRYIHDTQNDLYGQNVNSFIVEPGGTYGNHQTLKR
jgi:hypothetical protein